MYDTPAMDVLQSAHHLCRIELRSCLGNTFLLLAHHRYTEEKQRQQAGLEMNVGTPQVH